jgi:hypothetical protein
MSTPTWSPISAACKLDELTSRQVAAMFRTLAAADTRRGRPPTSGTLHRIRATLRAALNAAVREGLRSDNPPAMSSCPGRVVRTPRCGPTSESLPGGSSAQRPVVAVWTAQQLAAFLATIASDRLYVIVG